MSKNTDFFNLGPYHVKTVLELEPGQKMGKQRETGPKWPFHARSRASSALGVLGHARGKAPVIGCTRAYHAHPLLCSRGSVDPVLLDSVRVCGLAWLAGDTCRHLIGAALLQPTVDACLVPVAGHPFFFFLLCPLKTETQSPFLIFISFDS